MGGRPFPSESWMTELKKKFLQEIMNGKDLEMLKEQEIGSSPTFFPVEAVHIDRCLTNDQKHEASGSQGLSVLGFNVHGKKWNLQLRKENGTYFFSEDTRNKMTVANGWKRGTPVCIWGAPGGIFRDGNVRFLFTYKM